MFREMRRSKNLVDVEITKELLKNGIDGVLGTISENGYPYTTPVNYIYYNDKIYFHSALKGHKIDNIQMNEKVSFTVITKNDIIEESYTADFQSVILFGKAKLVEPTKELLLELIRKYSSSYMDKANDYIAKHQKATQLVEITIEHMTGKQRVKKKCKKII
ncbi:MAG: Pyridoxamine 5'-phosphate oxidase [Candidatus Izimaplasma bacterium HR2]|nr:MAG: Pyridoxamine 5'-phosphate oxidase [Candidatus Izimaplasma bacterium HR2]